MNEAILRQFSPRPVLLGEGIESRVYALGSNKILRIYKSASNHKHAERLELSKHLRRHTLPFDVPLLYSVHDLDGTLYTIEKRFAGEELGKILPGLKGKDRELALENYLRAAGMLRDVILSDLPYGELLSDKPVTNPDWVGYLKRRATRAATKSTWIKQDVKNFDEVMARVLKRIDRLPHQPAKSLVHGDFYPPNIYINKDLAITAVGDFSGLTVVGDYRMDIAGAVGFFLDPGDKAFMQELVEKLYDKGCLDVIKTYLLYYSVIFADCKEYDPDTYQWSVDKLNSFKPEC
jgi:Ser/Thr protein kinase RdoA (MazF antagonist)